MSDLSSKHILKFPSDPQEVSQVEHFVEKVARDLNLPETIQGNLLISLTEAVTNAIVHGNRNDRNKTVSISLRSQKNTLSIRVSDQGSGFDPQQIPDPTATREAIEACGGRGIFLMKNLADKCKFTRGGRSVEMRWKI